MDSLLISRVRDAKRVYIIGNGGSYANAMHIVNDLLACGVKAFAMDPATLTAFANDYGYFECFAKWLGTVGERGDLLIALSGSGKSTNILKACERAESIGMKVYRIYGAELGQNMQQAEEAQIVLGHKLREALCTKP